MEKRKKKKKKEKKRNLNNQLEHIGREMAIKRQQKK